MVGAYRALETTHPDTTWVYGETGWPWGGDFWPHRTHQNGLVVDFMVPVRTPDRESTQLPTWPWNGFGYGLDFDDAGQGEGHNLEIDFEAVAAHLAALKKSAGQNDLRIRKVIFAPALRKRMLRSDGARGIRGLPFSQRPVWVRHDDHYHVEFALWNSH
jgi:penicillin-insensitive murein endopeptidase